MGCGVNGDGRVAEWVYDLTSHIRDGYTPTRAELETLTLLAEYAALRINRHGALATFVGRRIREGGS